MSKRWAAMERFVVPNLDDPSKNYLERLRIVATPFFSIYLHRLGTPDSRPTLHDHPWSFVSLIVRGGYIEQRLNPHTRQTEPKHRRWVNVMRRDDFHYIESLDRTPTWTLLLVGVRRRTWGYLRPMHREGGWTWDQFDTDVHGYEFDRAMEQRRDLKMETP